MGVMWKEPPVFLTREVLGHGVRAIEYPGSMNEASVS